MNDHEKVQQLLRIKAKGCDLALNGFLLLAQSFRFFPALEPSGGGGTGSSPPPTT